MSITTAAERFGNHQPWRNKCNEHDRYADFIVMGHIVRHAFTSMTLWQRLRWLLTGRLP